MAEAPRSRPMEYYNPRPLILAICFFWGIAMGFCIFYFSPPKQMEQTSTPRPEPDQAEPRPDRGRWENLPPVTEISLTAAPTLPTEPVFKTNTLEPPVPALTTEGGLTGRTAQPINRTNTRPLSSPQPVRPTPTFTAPPPLPDLNP